VDNTCTAPIHVIDNEIYFVNCEWIRNNYRLTFTDTFDKAIRINNIGIDKSDIGIIPSNICKCTNINNHECISHKLGQTIPGQVLTTHLIVPRLSLSLKSSVMLIVETACLPPKSYKIIKAVEMTQTDAKTGCNQHNYV